MFSVQWIVLKSALLACTKTVGTISPGRAAKIMFETNKYRIRILFRKDSKNNSPDSRISVKVEFCYMIELSNFYFILLVKARSTIDK